MKSMTLTTGSGRQYVKSFGPMGISHRTFTDPEGSNRVGVIFEIPDLEAFQEALQSEEAAAAMKQDRVHPDTLLLLSES